MASAWRMVSFVFVIFVLPAVLISLPLYARYHVYHARQLSLTEGDVRSLQDTVSSFWCQSQQVTSINGTFEASLLPGRPQLAKSRRRSSIASSLLMNHDDVEYWGVYLVEGSSFDIGACARWPGGLMTIVRGVDNLRKCFYVEDRVRALLVDGIATRPGRVKYQGLPEEEGTRRDGNFGGEVFDEERVAVTKTKNGMEDLEEEELERNNEVERILNNGGGKGKNPASRMRHLKKKILREEERKNHHQRMSRSIFNDTDDDALTILHRFEDEVTWGNSSYSSSEEYLEGCLDTIASEELSPFVDCHDRLTNKTDDPWRFMINASDYYYFIFMSDNSIEQNHLHFRLSLHRKVYDIRDALEMCSNSTNCSFPLRFLSGETAVVEIPSPLRGEGGDLSELNTHDVNVVCQPRVAVYMIFFLMVPFVILLFAFQ